jgi:hypothetical protein
MDRSRLMVDARKWLASKLAPKKYGLLRVATDCQTAGGQTNAAERPARTSPGNWLASI